MKFCIQGNNFSKLSSSKTSQATMTPVKDRTWDRVVLELKSLSADHSTAKADPPPRLVFASPTFSTFSSLFIFFFVLLTLRWCDFSAALFVIGYKDIVEANGNVEKSWTWESSPYWRKSAKDLISVTLLNILPFTIILLFYFQTFVLCCLLIWTLVLFIPAFAWEI